MLTLDTDGIITSISITFLPGSRMHSIFMDSTHSRCIQKNQNTQKAARKTFQLRMLLSLPLLKNKNNGVPSPHTNQQINEDNYLKLFIHSSLFWRSTCNMWFKNWRFSHWRFFGFIFLCFSVKCLSLISTSFNLHFFN